MYLSVYYKGTGNKSYEPIVALLQDEYAGALDEGQLIRLLSLVVVLDDGGTDGLGGVRRQPPRHRRTFCGTWRTARWQRF